MILCMWAEGLHRPFPGKWGGAGLVAAEGPDVRGSKSCAEVLVSRVAGTRGQVQL